MNQTRTLLGYYVKKITDDHFVYGPLRYNRWLAHFGIFEVEHGTPSGYACTMQEAERLAKITND